MHFIKKIGIFTFGFALAAVIFSGVGNAWAANVLQAIYVDFEPIDIYIDGQLRNPPDDMKPMIYDGRTYVALRYIGEVFGKKVDWVGDSRSIIIAEERQQTNTYSESFTDAPRFVSFVKTDGNSWEFDGANGLVINSPGILTLFDVLPDAYCDYTVEFEAAVTGTGGTNSTGERIRTSWSQGPLAVFSLGKDRDGNNVEFFDINTNTKANLGLGYDAAKFDRVSIRYRETLTNGYDLYSSNGSLSAKSIKTIEGSSSNGGYVTGIEHNKFIPVKVQVKDRYANLYINGELIVTRELTMSSSAFAFVGVNWDRYSSWTSSGKDGCNYNIRNFKITID